MPTVTTRIDLHYSKTHSFLAFVCYSLHNTPNMVIRIKHNYYNYNYYYYYYYNYYYN
jgi:hypothetical protein